MGGEPDIDFYKNQYVGQGMGSKSHVAGHDSEALPVKSRKQVPVYAVHDALEPADQEMDLEPGPGNHGALGQQRRGMNYSKLHKMMKSHVWSQRAQALEDFLRYLIDMQPEQLMSEFEQERDFAPLVE